MIKSLDHWPDLGSDLDLYTDAEPLHVVNAMSECFSAKLADRSWGDRLANKWNFIVPGLPELVEVHAGRLGQTGEQTAVTRSVSGRTQHRCRLGRTRFRVPRPKTGLSSARCNACTGISTSACATSSTMRGFWTRELLTLDISTLWDRKLAFGRALRRI